MRYFSSALLAVFLSTLAATNAAAQWSAWQVGKTTELVSGQQRMVAQLRTVDVDQQSYRSHRGALLSIFCDGSRTGARIMFLGKVSYSSKVTVRYRTDRHEQKDFQTETSSDRRSVYFQSGAQAAEFARHVGASTKLMVRADAPGPGMSHATFNTAGAAEAIAAALRDCR